MKFIVIFVLSSLAFAIALAFPDNRSAAIGVPTVGMHANSISDTGRGAAATSLQTAQIREPRHLLTKLFNPQPQVIVQPILIQPQPFQEIGRGYIGGYSSGFEHTKNIGYWGH